MNKIKIFQVITKEIIDSNNFLVLPPVRQGEAAGEYIDDDVISGCFYEIFLPVMEF